MRRRLSMSHHETFSYFFDSSFLLKLKEFWRDRCDGVLIFLAAWHPDNDNSDGILVAQLRWVKDIAPNLYVSFVINWFRFSQTDCTKQYELISFVDSLSMYMYVSTI